MNYGFVIDNRTCIGCHACTTACKAENEVPLGVNRTWVKTVETGLFPNTQRHFQVTRCNHCANPPCVTICPTAAMYQREDGIVEFDSDICIGCKACMQACPYDAIYLDPENSTAAKCHFCPHRVELGLEPACVIVCPTHSIIAGDLDDPNSEISRMLATHEVTVRKPEQGTAPKLFYINGNDAALHPTAVERQPATFMAADVIPIADIQMPSHDRSQGSARDHTPTTDQPLYFGRSIAQQMIQVSYNAQHAIPWRWPVPAYMVAKAIGAGMFLLLGFGLGFGLVKYEPAGTIAALILSLLFVGINTGLLVYDLAKPERFFMILLRPQWKSWLTRGAFILIAFTVVAGLWLLAELALQARLLDPAALRPFRSVSLWTGLPLAAGTAIYTAFLLGQAEGRDLWQSPLLPFHLFLQAVLAGSGMYLVLDLFLPLASDLLSLVKVIFLSSLVIDVLITLLGELGMRHASETAERAARAISHGAYRNDFWWGSVGLGHLLPLLILLADPPGGGAIAGVAAVIGLYLFEYAFIRAPQDVPNS